MSTFFLNAFGVIVTVTLSLAKKLCQSCCSRLLSGTQKFLVFDAVDIPDAVDVPDEVAPVSKSQDVYGPTCRSMGLRSSTNRPGISLGH